jgi:hypothetical protein
MDKEIIEVKFVDSFLDGGTSVYKDINGKYYYVDNRIFSTTPGLVFESYPDNSDIPLNVELKIMN